MLTHINQFSRFLNGQKCGFNHHIRSTHKGNHSSVCGFSRVYIKQFNTFNLFDNICYLVNDFHVAAFAEIRHTLHKFVYIVHVRMYLFNVCLNTRYYKTLAQIYEFIY